MILFLFPQSWLDWARRGKRPTSVAGLLTAEELRQAMERERMRADRSGVPFAVLVLDIHRPSRTQDAKLAAAAAQALVSRLRATDLAGYCEDGRLAAILPATSELGAHVLAQRVTEAVGLDDSELPYEVFLYPHRASGQTPGASRDVTDQEPVAAGPRSVEAWFVQPLPFWKRCLDVLGASVGLILAAPVLLLAALAIKLTSPGPALFTQKRRGLGGRDFTIYKLRTMRVDAESLKAALRAQSEQDGPAFKMKRDPRVTPVGRYLRKACIDELPQLWNVLIGDMSLVGPRPLPCDEADNCAGWQQRRLHVTPGLTCTWQILGGLRVPFPDWMRMDLRYARKRRLWVDLKLILQTIVAAVTHRASH